MHSGPDHTEDRKDGEDDDSNTKIHRRVKNWSAVHAGVMRTYVLLGGVFGRLCCQLVMSGLASAFPRSPIMAGGKTWGLAGVAKCALRTCFMAAMGTLA